MKKQFYILLMVFVSTSFTQNHVYADSISNGVKWTTKISDSVNAVKKIDPKTLVVGKPMPVEYSNVELVQIFVKEIFNEYPFTSWFFTVMFGFWLISIIAKLFKRR